MKCVTVTEHAYIFGSVMIKLRNKSYFERRPLAFFINRLYDNVTVVVHFLFLKITNFMKFVELIERVAFYHL